MESVFLYNSELWGLNKTKSNQIDSFQRNLLRKVLNIKWPKQITTEALYELTKVEKWSHKIKKRRLTFLGHIMRLDRTTPVRIAFEEAVEQGRNKRGRR